MAAPGRAMLADTRTTGRRAEAKARTRPSGAVVAVVAVTVVGLGLRLGWLLYAAPDPASDFVAYRNLAFDLLDTGVFGYDGNPSAYRPPTYVWLLTAAALVSRSTAWLGLVNVVLSASVPPLLYLAATRLGLGFRPAVAAAGIAAVYPAWVFFAPVLASEHGFLPLLLVLVLVLLPAHGELTLRRAVAGGLLFGVATLARGEALFYAPVFALVVALTLRRAGVAWRVVAGRLALVALAGVVMLTPWVVRNHVVVGPGAGLTTTAGLNLYYAHNPVEYAFRPSSQTPMAGLGEIDRHRLGMELAVDYVRDHPGSLVTSAWLGSLELYAPPSYGVIWSSFDYVAPGERADEWWIAPGLAVSAVAWWLLVALAAGSLLARRRWSTAAAVWVAGVVIMNWVGYALIFFGNVRYRMAAEVALAVAAGVSLAALTQRRAQPSARRRTAALRRRAIRAGG